MKRRVIPLIVIPSLLAAAVAVFFLFGAKTENKPKEKTYKTSVVTNGNIEETVSSTGTLQAVGAVDVRSQLTGVLEKVYVDFNDQVTKNQKLAEINTDKLEISLREARAALDKSTGQHDYDTIEYEKAKKLHAASLISDSELAAKKLSYTNSKAALEQAQASYEEASIDLRNYAVILSPINGIVLDRAVEEGETVSGGNANTRLFTLAENLGTMDIEALVDELDISKLALGQKARFTVEAHADRTFEGTVRQIRVVPKSSGNVVSYTVIVRAANPDALLLPGMTATVEFLVTEKKNVVLVPSAALRFSPAPEEMAAARRRAFAARLGNLSAEEREAALKQYDERIKAAGGAQAGLLGGGNLRALAAAGGGAGPVPGGAPPAGAPGGAFPGAANNRNTAARAAVSAQRAAAVDAESRKVLWYLDENGELAFRAVRVGASDASNTELLDADDLVGTAVIVKAE